MRKSKRKPLTLPKDFKKYFWDVDFKDVSPGKYPAFILSRLMSLGDMRAVRWLLEAFTKRAIKNFVLKSGNRQLDRRSNNFWRIYFDLPPGKPVAGKLWPY